MRLTYDLAQFIFNFYNLSSWQCARLFAKHLLAVAIVSACLTRFCCLILIVMMMIVVGGILWSAYVIDNPPSRGCGVEETFGWSTPTASTILQTIHASVQPYLYLLCYSLVLHAFIQLFICIFIHLCIHSLYIHLCIHSYMHSFIYSFIHVFMYSS